MSLHLITDLSCCEQLNLTKDLWACHERVSVVVYEEMNIFQNCFVSNGVTLCA